jgi:hypothetical protein
MTTQEKDQLLSAMNDLQREASRLRWLVSDLVKRSKSIKPPEDILLCQFCGQPCPPGHYYVAVITRKKSGNVDLEVVDIPGNRIIEVLETSTASAIGRAQSFADDTATPIHWHYTRTEDAKREGFLL